jgi:hypothetical protein
LSLLQSSFEPVLVLDFSHKALSHSAYREKHPARRVGDAGGEPLAGSRALQATPLQAAFSDLAAKFKDRGVLKKALKTQNLKPS